MLRRIFDGDEPGEDFGLGGPVVGFVSGTILGSQEEMADVGEGGGAARRDAIGGESLEEFAEDMVDIDLGDEIAGGAGEFFDEVLFASRYLQSARCYPFPKTAISTTFPPLWITNWEINKNALDIKRN